MSSKFTKESYDKLNDNKLGVTVFRPIEEMTIEEIKDELNNLRERVQKKDTLYGYDVEKLIGISNALMRDDITVKDLDNAIIMYKKGWDEALKMTNNAIKGVFNKEDTQWIK